MQIFRNVKSSHNCVRITWLEGIDMSESFAVLGLDRDLFMPIEISVCLI
jgi:hypothetical protein